MRRAGVSGIRNGASFLLVPRRRRQESDVASLLHRRHVLALKRLVRRLVLERHLPGDALLQQVRLHLLQLLLSVQQLLHLLDGCQLLGLQFILLHLKRAQLPGHGLAGGRVSHPLGELPAVPDGEFFVRVDVLDGEEEDPGALLVGDQVLSVAVVRGRDVPHPVRPVGVFAVQIEHDAAGILVVDPPEVLPVVGQRVAGGVDVRNHRPELGSLGDDVVGEDAEDAGVEDGSGRSQVQVSGQAFRRAVFADGGGRGVLDDVDTQ